MIFRKLYYRLNAFQFRHYYPFCLKYGPIHNTKHTTGLVAHQHRFVSGSGQEASSKKPQPGSRYVKPTAGIRHYLVEKYFNFVKGYERILETKFPRAFRVYQVFLVGSRELFRDIREYMRISQDLRYGRSVRDLSRKELEAYFTVPKEMRKVAPVLILTALPFANYIVFPLAYLFPRYFLSSHFWSLQQRLDFALHDQKRRLHNYRPVFRILQAKVASIPDPILREKCENILYKIGSGVHAQVDEIIQVKPLFEEGIYGLNNISGSHLKFLCRMHGLSTWLGKRPRLWTHAGFVREIDLAMFREGISTMNHEELRKACFLRGLNPIGLPRDEMIEWLEKWVLVSRNIDSKSLSLLLHCPIFLAYNYTTNWSLIH